MVKYNVMGNQSVTVSEVSSIPSDAIDVNFSGDFPAFYKDYNTLEGLATGLVARGLNNSTTINADNLLDTGLYAISKPSTENNFPTNATGFLISLKAAEGFYMQIFSATSLYLRGKWNNSWGDWKTIAFE